MFRVSQYMHEILQPTPVGPRRDPRGPVVIWNLIRRCNLTCRHCYSISTDIDFPGELTTQEVFDVMDDLHRAGVRVLILSGGEPLLRNDIAPITARAKARGFYVGLSTNGTLIDEDRIRWIAEAGFDYLGISIDGRRETHDAFRRKQGAYDASMRAVRLAHAARIKVGLRFTLTQDNARDLPALLDLVDDEGIDKFYLSHLNYAGRGNVNRKRDALHRTTRAAMDTLFDWTWRHVAAGVAKEIVTGNNDADGVYLLKWTAERHPGAVPHLHAKLAQWGGNASGVNVANIDNLGNVHPDTMWWHHTLGNVRRRAFGDIWADVSDPLMAGLKSRPRKVGGRCSSCAFFDICSGNTRVRAQQLSGDAWAEDPGCYLTDEEIGLASDEAPATSGVAGAVAA